jgi:hypothetical protein
MESRNNNSEPIVVSIADIKNHLKNGITRKIGDANYNAEIGSIQEIYAMSAEDVTMMFKEPRLRNLKVCIPKVKNYIFSEDLPTENTESDISESNNHQENEVLTSETEEYHLTEEEEF